MLKPQCDSTTTAIGTPFAARSARAAAEGVPNEEQRPVHNHRPSKAKKTKKAQEKCRLGQHRAAIHGIAAPPRTDIKGGVLASRSVNVLRQRLVRSGYLAAIAMAMAGWIWLLFEGLQWVIGV
jgi:hypothetical protein